MATDRPEYFYHPAVGVISPASLSLFRLNTATPLLTQVNQGSTPPAPIQPPSLATAKTATVQSSMIQSMVAPEEGSMTKESVPPAPRKATHLSRTEPCAVTGETCSVHDMIRFVISPDLKVTPDLAEKLPGHAVYIKADLGTLKKAMWRNTFTTIARDTIEVPKNLIEMVEAGLSRQALATLSLARRAGELMMGFASVEERIKIMPNGVYVVAKDASDLGRTKIEKHLKSADLLDLWSSQELSIAIGEANTNHLFIEAGGLADNLMRTAKKLKAVRTEA